MQLAHTDKGEVGMTITMTPNKVGMYSAVRIGGTDVTGQMGVTYKHFDQLFYLAGGGVLLDENPNRVAYCLEGGLMVLLENISLQFGVGTTEFKTTNLIIGIGLNYNKQ